RQLVEIMGGKIDVKSTQGQGSEFRFEMAFGVSEVKLKNTKESSVMGSVADLKGLKVLLAEDNQINRFLAQTILEQWNCEVDHAETGKQAYEKAGQNKYDLILMDMRMPEMDGLMATELIRNELKLKVPIIALTANAIK